MHKRRNTKKATKDPGRKSKSPASRTRRAKQDDGLGRRYEEREIAEFFGISVKTLRHWRLKGWIRNLKHGARVVFTREQIEECEARLAQTAKDRTPVRAAI
jgi:uncharacterized protein YjcR